MKKNLDLALPPYGLNSVPRSPESAGPDYPTLHLEGKEGELEFPDEGVATFRYCVKSETTTKNPDGSEKCTYTLEIKNLVSVKKIADERPSKRDTSTEDNLDRLMKEKEAASKDDEGDY
jgi:hypothetical protein